MLLQAGGRADALRALLRAELERADLLRLANALSAMYPNDSEGNRLPSWTPCYWPCKMKEVLKVGGSA